MNYAKAGASPACIAVENPIVRFVVDPVLGIVVQLRADSLHSIFTKSISKRLS